MLISFMLIKKECISEEHFIGPVIDTVANCFATSPMNITPICCSTKICQKVALMTFTIEKEYS